MQHTAMVLNENGFSTYLIKFHFTAKVKNVGATYINIRVRIFHSSLQIALTFCTNSCISLYHSKELTAQRT